ncbi:helix-turn-helix domain-containing protein [Streptosporangium sp. NPDC004631]
MVEDRYTFGEWLSRQLRRQNMSQADLAMRLDVTRAAVSAWVTGRAEPRMDKIHAIAEILGVDPGAVMTREDSPSSAGSLAWYHRPAHIDGGRELGNAATFAFDADLSVLARETTQNSLDEQHDPNQPVRVRHLLHEISGERLQRFLEALHWNELEPHFEAAADPARRQKVGRVLANGIHEMRENDTLLLLRVDDYNARGLTGPDYDDGRFAAVVRRLLDSHKLGTAGGSYGLGKATLWATSQLGLVMINSVLSEPHEGRSESRMIGRLDLPWHHLDGVDYAGPAWFGEADPQRDGVARSWWADPKTVEELYLARESAAPGTSFLIVGAHDSAGDATDLEGMHSKLVTHLARNFWASMISSADTRPLLEASVTAMRNGVVVIEEERVDPHVHEPARSRAVRAFLEGTTVSQPTRTDHVVQSSVALGVPPLKEDARRGERQLIEHQAILLMTQTDDTDEKPNQLVCMRGNRMVVTRRAVPDVPLGSFPFQAVLLAGQATGSNLPDAQAAERFLRTSEPPEHNAWKTTDDLIATYARGAASRLTEFRREAQEEIRRIVRRPEGDQDGPDPLDDLLRVDPPAAPRNPGFPTVKHVQGSLTTDGAWQVRVEVRLPVRVDPWLMAPVLRFVTRSGPYLHADWRQLTAELNCEVTSAGNLAFKTGARSAVFHGISDVTSHPVAAQMSAVEIDLTRAKESAA